MPVNNKTVRTACAGFAILALGACDAEKPTSPLSSTASNGPALAVVLIDSTWNYYEADVTVEATGGYQGFPMDTAFRSVSFRTVRTLGSNDVWSTRNTYNPSPGGPTPAVDPHIDVAVTETADDGSYFRMYDRAGALVSQANPDTTRFQSAELPFVPDTAPPMPGYPTRPSGPPPPDEPAPPGTCVEPPCPLLSRALVNNGPPSVSLAVTGKGKHKDSRAWLDRVIVSPESRLRALARIDKRYGKAAEKVGKLDRHVRKRGEKLLEILVDPVLGAVVEENIAERGELLSHTTYQFEDIGGGLYLNTMTETELAPHAPGAKRMVIRSRLKNVNIARKGAP